MEKKKRPTRPQTHKSLVSPRVQHFSAVFLVTVGAGLLIGGFFVPPTGEIHGSVLVAFGEILTFAGALFGIDYHYKAKSIISK